MKFLIFALSVLFFSLSYANDDSSTNNIETTPVIDIYFTDVPASEVAEYANSKCKGQIEPIVVHNPDARLSINFEKIECRGVVEILKDFDSRKS